MNKTYIGLAVLAVIIIGYFMWGRGSSEQPPEVMVFDGQAAAQDLQNSNQKVGIEEYVKNNIAGLSGEAGFPEVLGGTFMVTKFSAQSGKGTVEYEDGHNAYTADFSYSTDKNGLVSVTSFNVHNK